MNTTVNVIPNRMLVGPAFRHPAVNNGNAPMDPSLGAYRKPTAISLFSGLGSFSKALRDLGYRVVAHDFMAEACATLLSNGIPVVQGDIRQVDFNWDLYSDVEVIIGGPPCQPFSQGGRNAGEDDYRDMIPDFIRAVAEIQPRFFMMENVRGLAGPRHKDYLAGRISEMEALGYIVEHRVLDAAEYGVPQSRKRLFVMGIRADVAEERGKTYPISWPAKSPGATMAEALGWDEQTIIDRNGLAPMAAWDYEKSLWPLTRPSTTVVGSFRPECQAAPGYRKAGDGPRQNAPGTVVTTVAERLTLQQMPATWVVCGSKSKVDLQVGNSCPNGLVKALLGPNV